MYRIHTAAEQAGLTPQLVRAWERRYGLLEPERTDAGYRLYSEDDVAVLRGAKALVDQGRSISEVARVGRDELLCIGRSMAFMVSASLQLSPDRSASLSDAPSAAFLKAAIEAIAALDGARLQSLLAHATHMGSASGIEICDRLLLPLLREIGDHWERGSLDIAAEHFGSSIIRRHLHLLVEEESRRNAGSPAVVCACPEGDLHEGGLLGFALHAAAAGWALVYLGANTPVDEMIAAANRGSAHAIGVSMTASLNRRNRSHLASRLVAWKSTQPGRRIWLGGAGALANRKELAASGVDILDEATRVPPVPLAHRSR